MTQVIIIHGWSGSPDANWFGWLRDALAAHNIAVCVPQMPAEDFPRVATWTAAIAAATKTPDDRTFFVGHSLGNMAILHYLQSLPATARIGGVLLVAPYMHSIGIPFLDDFLADPVDYAKVKEIVQKIAVIASDNDPYVPLAMAQDVADVLGAQMHIMPDAGHINDVSGYTTLEDGLAVLQEMMGEGK